jgi:hypothetical protein
MLAGYRLGVALLCLVAIVVQIDHLRDLSIFKPANFFSFLTIQSNLLVVAVLVYSAVRSLGHQAWPRLDRLRTAATLYISLTFVVYGLLLSGYRDELQTTVIWVDNVVHKIIPLAMLADWLLDPPRLRLSWRDGPTWLLYPLAYVVYSLVRGAVVDWYPYPFLNPDESNGYVGVFAYCLAIAVGVALATWAVLWISRARQLEPAASTA